MKNLLIMLLSLVFIVWNLPFIVLTGAIGLYKRDSQYIGKFIIKLSDAFNSFRDENS